MGSSFPNQWDHPHPAQYFLGRVILTYQKKFNFQSNNDNKSVNTHVSQLHKFCPYPCSVYIDSRTYGTNISTFEYTKIKLLICHYGIHALSFVLFLKVVMILSWSMCTLFWPPSLTSNGMHLGNSWQRFKVQICG